MSKAQHTPGPWYITAQDELLTAECLEIGRRAIEDALIELRDARLSEPLSPNGLVVREKDGTDSSIIRFGPKTALLIGIKAMLSAIAKAKGA